MATVEEMLSFPREPWEIEWEAYVAKIIRFRADLIEQVCAIAVADGRYGVRIDSAGVRIDKEVPAFNIHHHNDGTILENNALSWSADFRIPE